MATFLLLSGGTSEDAKIKAPYGSWPSPITADLIVKDTVAFEDVKEDRGDLYFTEVRPMEKGRATVVRITKEGATEELIPEKFNARTTVHEYGGGSLLIEGPKLYFSNFDNQQLYRKEETIEQLTFKENCRFADGCASGALLFYVMEEHAETVKNCLVAINQKGEVKKIAEGADFYSAPRVSPDGKKLAYYCWNHPNMPWDGGELRVADLQEDGTLTHEHLVAGGDDESICQHAWSPSGRLYYTSNRSGSQNLYCEGKPLYPMEAEIGFPQWFLGQTYFAFWNERIVFIYSKLGTDHLAYLDDGQLVPIDVPYPSIRNLSITGDNLYFIGSSPEIPSSIVKIDLTSKNLTVIKKSANADLLAPYISTPEAICFPTTGDQVAHAFYYPPKNLLYQGTEGELPPLLVLSHGGPTAHESPAYNLEIQYWTSRGFAVVDVNYGGSSGYGKAYQDRLKGNWGLVDVDDCTNAALYSVNQGWVDRNRLCIAGGSAGGFTTLACLAFKEVFKAGASYYGVSDLEALTLDTHKFEARYLEGLLGKYPEARDVYIARSPIHHIEKINCPVILLQGDEDKIVLPPQSEKMYQSLLERGIPTAYLLFEKEQHGFRQSENIKRSIEAVAYFFSKIFGFTLADPVEPLKIENFNE